MFRCESCFERFDDVNECANHIVEELKKDEKECQCTLCFCYKTKKHIDLSDIEIIIQDVRMNNPVSECLSRLCREDALNKADRLAVIKKAQDREKERIQKEKLNAQSESKNHLMAEEMVRQEQCKKADRLVRLRDAQDFWLKCTEVTESYRKEREEFNKNHREFLDKVFGDSKPKELKAPLHPGKIANELLIAAGYGTFRRGIAEVPGFDKVVELGLVSEKLNMTGGFLLNFLNGLEDIDYNLAFKISYIIKGTDVKFWIKLQENYDEYMRANK